MGVVFDALVLAASLLLAKILGLKAEQEESPGFRTLGAKARFGPYGVLLATETQSGSSNLTGVTTIVNTSRTLIVKPQTNARAQKVKRQCHRSSL